MSRKTAKKVQNNLLLLCGVTKIFNYVFLVSNTNVMIEFPPEQKTERKRRKAETDRERKRKRASSKERKRESEGERNV